VRERKRERVRERKRERERERRLSVREAGCRRNIKVVLSNFITNWFRYKFGLELVEVI
jgi:hypothetical protein